MGVRTSQSCRPNPSLEALEPRLMLSADVYISEFMARNDSSANILATLTGTKNPELIYVLSSHYDSNRRSPGADDNNSAVAVLLETARILKDTPMPATILFAAFTGEEAGLLGRIGDKIFKNTDINPYLFTRARAYKRARDYLREYQKDHSKLSTSVPYSPHLKVGQTLLVVDDLNRINKRFFIDSLRNNSGVITLILARYP